MRSAKDNVFAMNGGRYRQHLPVSKICLRATGIPIVEKVLLLILFAILPSTITFAQSPSTIVINYPQAVEEAEALQLNVYFTVVDEAGRPVTNANLESMGTLQIIGDSVSYDAEVSAATSPLYIALVLDASGSMGGAVNDLRQAAVAAIDSAPQQASLAIFQFNAPTANGQTLQLLHDFSADHESLKRSIESFQSQNAGTCINYAATEAIQTVQAITQDKPEARRAVILFTDGFDELTTGRRDTCSVGTTVQQVISTARDPGESGSGRAVPVPIYTIGMAGANPVDETTLRRFALETGGLTAIGSQAELSSQFRQIMEGLANQWLASVQVLPTAGSHQASLAVRAVSPDDSSGRDLSATFAFESSRDYSVSEPSVYRASWVDAENRFRINVTNPGSISRVEILVLKEEGGEVETLRIEPLDAGTDAQYTAPTLSRLEAGRRYRAQVYVYDPSGNPITRNDDPVLATVDFTYEPPTAPQEPLPIVRIVEVVPDPVGRTMLVNLDAKNTEKIERYRVMLFNESTRSAIPSFTVFPTQSGGLLVDLDQFSAEPGIYRIAVMPLDLKGESLLPEEISYPNQVAYAPREPSTVQRLGQAFREYPWIPLLILLFIIGLIAFFVYSHFRNQRSSSLFVQLDDKQLTPRSPLRNPTNLFGSGRRRNAPIKPPSRHDSGVIVPGPSPKPVEKPRPPSHPSADREASSATHRLPPSEQPSGTQPIRTDSGSSGAEALPSTAGQAPPSETTSISGITLQLHIEQSPDERSAGRILTVTEFPLVIGRETSHLLINDRKVSRQHAQLTVRGDRIYITDPGSSNGTFIVDTNQKLRPKTEYEIHPGRTRLRLGDTILTIELRR